jgi:methionyl-tRNA synthetase
MSKSKGNVAYAEPIARTVGVDALRYYLLRDVPFGQDGNFSHDALLTRYNSDLANGLGNLASRTLTMIGRYCEGQVPPGCAEAAGGAEASIIGELTGAVRIAVAQYEELSFSRALEVIWAAISKVDGYLTNEKPWTLAGDTEKRRRLETVLFTAAEALRIIVALAHPVLPQATAEIWRQLGQHQSLGETRIDELSWGQLRPGTQIGEPAAVFPRVDKNETLEKISNMEQDILNPKGTPPTASTLAPGPGAPAGQPAASAAAVTNGGKITIDDFSKVEMRVGEVKSAERVAGADKLLKVMVDIGGEVRQVVAGIAAWYQPEQLVGRKVIVVVNLQPRKLRGVESNGMIVAASFGAEGRPVLAGFLEDVPVGSRLK